jgi:hypothetical protein
MHMSQLTINLTYVSLASPFPPPYLGWFQRAALPSALGMVAAAPWVVLPEVEDMVGRVASSATGHLGWAVSPVLEPVWVVLPTPRADGR